MKIKIDNKEFLKNDLLKLIKQNKIQAIIHVRGIINMGLKEAKEIIDNLEENPDYYDDTIITRENKNFTERESIIVGIKKANEEDVFKIENEFFAKKKLLILIRENKSEAIKYLKDVLKIGLKDCKEIVDNLSENPNFYKNDIIELKDSDKVEVGELSRDQNTKKRGSHFIKDDNQSKKKILIFGLIFIGIIFLYVFLKSND